MAATIPNCRAWDPAFAGELAVILDHGMREMLVEQRDVFHYITLMNENHAQPDLPDGAAPGVLRGAYVFRTLGPADATQAATLMGSGAILSEVLKAGEQLAAEGWRVDVVSVTSWSELARDGAALQQRALAAKPPLPGPHGRTTVLQGTRGPIVAATDYVRAVPEAVRAYLPEGRRCLTLGTDGFGRSDTRQALRELFGVDAASVARAVRHLAAWLTVTAEAAAARLRVGPRGGSESSRCAALRAASPAMLAPAVHRETRSVHCVHSAQTLAVSQFTKRACGARPQALRFSGVSIFAAARAHPQPCNNLGGARGPACHHASGKAEGRAGQGLGRIGRLLEKRQGDIRPRAAGALRELTRGECLSAANAVSGASFAAGRSTEHRRGRGAKRHAKPSV